MLHHPAVEEHSQHLSSGLPDSCVGSRDMGPGFGLSFVGNGVGEKTFIFYYLKCRGFHSPAYIAWSLLESTEHFWLSATCTAALYFQNCTDEQDRDFALSATPLPCSASLATLFASAAPFGRWEEEDGLFT